MFNFNNQIYQEADGNIHVNPAIIDEVQETLKCTGFNQDKELQDELDHAGMQDHVVMHIVGVIMAQQYSIKKCIKLFSEKWKQAVTKELTQLHDMETYHPAHTRDLTKEQCLEALLLLIFLTQKRTGG